MDRTVQDLLAFARPGKPDVEPCDVHTVLDRVLILLAENPEAKGVRVVRAYQPGIPRVPADGKQLQQVFLNLLLNAVDAIPDGGRITVKTHADEEGKSVAVELHDTGKGIPPELREKIFQPFFTTKGKGKGSGLGLAVSKRIVEEHGGTIQFANSSDGGVTFTIMLPVKGEEDGGVTA